MTLYNEPGDAQQPRTISGHPVLDMQLENVGKVTDVLYDAAETVARWAVVKTGVFGGEHYVPLDNSYLDEDGRLVLPFDKASIKRAPKARGAHVITDDVARELWDYYGVAA